MVGLGIRLEKSSGRLGMFYLFFTICALGLMRIVVVDEQHLMPPPVPTSSAASNASVVPSTSPITRFTDLSLRSPAINSFVSNNPAMQQQGAGPGSRRMANLPQHRLLLRRAGVL